MANVHFQPPMLTGDCSRCGADSTTLDVSGLQQTIYNFPRQWEAFAVCRRCSLSNIFQIEQINSTYDNPNISGKYIDGCFNIGALPPTIPTATKCPDYVPADIAGLFVEGAKTQAIACYDAAGTMFRKVLDASTRAMIIGTPETLDKSDPDYIAWKTYKDLGLRLEWLFARNRLPRELQALATCVHQDGNDAAHSELGIGALEAADLSDFTVDFLEAVYTLPGRVAESERRREQRKQHLLASRGHV